MSGGMDVTVAHVEQVAPDQYAVYLGLNMQPPPGYRIRFSPRSSISKTNWIIQNSPCLGDADYFGEYRLMFRCLPSNVDLDGFAGGAKATLTYDSFPYEVGDRCAQMWVEEVLDVEFEENELENITDRKGGFGSTDEDSMQHVGI
jgi:dUTPase